MTTLLEEIRAACTPEEIAARNDELIATRVSARRGTRLAGVARGDFAVWAAASGLRAAIEDHAADPGSPLRSAALALKDFLAGAAATIDFSLPANVALLRTWQAVGAITQAQADELLAAASVSDPVSVADVSAVLNEAS